MIGAIVTLLGIAIASEWVPVPGRRTTTTGGTQTTVIQDSTRD